ncbi:bi-domain-containing oxidoreductase [Streptomyces sp. NPDC058659]|uniref:bi-domain-containing oxidoreductase n=1 Tax=unclassified Streptomyces TaxID=2593676 RepID=UPI00366626F0
MKSVVLSGVGVCEVIERDEPQGGPGDVVVDVGVSVVSPGTERAVLLDLPTAGARFPEYPGYMAAGTVRAAASIPAGTRVAVRRARHASVAAVPAAHVRVVPDHVPLVDAAVWQLALTALHGLERGGQRPGEPVTVIGGGLLGVITRRLATARGAASVRAVAGSPAKAWAAKPEPVTTFLSTGEAADGTPLVLDVTGSGAALHTAVALAEDGGRVVLLGSPRTELADVPLQLFHDRGLDLLGAHVSRMDEEERTRLSDVFFDLLARDLFTVRDVLDEYPADEAPSVYRRLATDRTLISAALRWDAHRPSETPAVPAASADPARESASSGAVTRQRTSTEHTRRTPAAPPLRFGLIGCGDIGIEDARALADAEGAELAACHDPVEQLAEDTVARYGGSHERDLDRLLARPDVDAVIIATPHDTHEPLLAAALAAGKHVLMEKPLAQDLVTARRMAEAADASGLTTGVLFPTRTDPRFLRAREAIETGAIGAPLGVAAHYLVDKDAEYFHGGLSGRSPSTWRLSKARSGGGFLIMNLIHQVDTIRALLGREADHVYAETAPSVVVDAPDIEDAVTLVIRFGGVIATLVGASSVVGGDGQHTRVWGEEGHVQVMPHYAVTTRGRSASAEAAPAKPTAIDLRAWAFTRFSASVRDGAPVDVSLSDALRTQAVVEAAYASARLGRATVPAPDDAGGAR